MRLEIEVELSQQRRKQATLLFVFKGQLGIDYLNIIPYLRHQQSTLLE